jgi:hypothetical protein
VTPYSTKAEMTLRLPALLTLLSVLGAGPLAADTIHLLDGKTIEGVQVVSEGIREVSYKEGRTDRTVAADTVASVDYEKKPQALDEAEEYLLQEDPESAVLTLDAYVEAALRRQVPGSQRWAPPFAAWRTVQLRELVVDLKGVRSSAALIIENYPETRFVPLAYLAKARAELLMGQASQARASLGELSGLISSQSLGQRWELECRLGEAESDESLSPASRRNEVERIIGEAGGLPWVQARAQVLLGEAFLAQAVLEASASKDLRGQAREAFQRAVASESAGRGTVARAHVGLGESLFLLGADTSDKAILEDAVLNCLRVITLYRDQGSEMARALFFAMRCFDLMSDGQRKSEMKRELLRLFPGTSWAADAKKY